jgi:glutathione S-transferase
MKLYYAPGACSLSPHIVALEAGLSVELRKVDLKSKQVEGGADFTKINPKGSVPALELDDGQILTEGPAIVQYLADLKPATNLAPRAGTLERYRLAEWLNFITSEIHKSFTPLFRPDSAPQWKQAAIDNLSRRFEFTAHSLAGKSYLLGDQFTVADAYLFTVLGWARHVGIDLARWPDLQHYVERVAARPQVKAALAAERAAKNA